MALNNVAAHRSNLGGHTRVLHARLDAATLLRGEFCTLQTDGDVAEIADNPAVDTVIGISAGGPSTFGPSENNPRTGAAYAAGDVVPILVADDSTEFVTTRFSTDAPVATTIAVPTRANIGDNIGLFVTAGGVHGVSNNAGYTTVGMITDVLDAEGVSLNETTAGAGVSVVFKLFGGSWNRGA